MVVICKYFFSMIEYFCSTIENCSPGKRISVCRSTSQQAKPDPGSFHPILYILPHPLLDLRPPFIGPPLRMHRVPPGMVYQNKYPDQQNNLRGSGSAISNIFRALAGSLSMSWRRITALGAGCRRNCSKVWKVQQWSTKVTKGYPKE